MAFCVKCGNENADGVKFCVKCGTPVGGAAPAATEAPKAGGIRKCPACGTPIESFQSRCPSCGHELSNTQVSNTVQEFTRQINEYDAEIAAESNPQSSKNILKTVGWVILNIYTLAIPLIIKFLKNFVFPTTRPLTVPEQKKKSYIENFIVPANREDIIEFVMFAGSKVQSSIDQGGKDVGIVKMWAKVWSEKCQQLITRAGVALADDKKTMETIHGLVERPKAAIAKLQQKEFIKIGVFLVLAIAMGALLIVPNLELGVKLPPSATVPAEGVSFTGSLDGYFAVTGSGILFEPSSDGTKVTLTMEIQALKSFKNDLNKKAEDIKKERNWKKTDSYKLEPYYGTEITLGDLKPEYSSSTDFIETIANMEVNSTKKVTLKMEPSGGKRKEILSTMSRSQLTIKSKVVYQLWNNSADSDKRAEITF